MPNASTTQASSASDASGQPIPDCYGYIWATGKRAEYYQLQDTGNRALDYTRAGIWLLGDGEWDGCQELYINDVLVWNGVTTLPTRSGAANWLGWDWIMTLDSQTQDLLFHWHPGIDSIIGSGMNPVSTGGDQGMDTIWSVFPPAINPLHYSRIAYYALMRKQPIENQTNTNNGDPSQWTDINPIGLWRSRKCRIFDDDGNMVGYAFTTNPVWHWVDARLRRKLMPEFNITSSGIDDLTSAVRACFDWSKIYTSAQYCDEILPNGRRRFEGSYAFTQLTSLQAIESQIALICRGYFSNYGGQYALNIDMPRSSVFTFSRQHALPGSFEASDKSIHSASNDLVMKFRDLLVPECNLIASITCPAGGQPTLVTTLPHPCNAGDWIAIGGTDTTYDGEWEVFSVPAILNVGTPEEVDPSSMVLVRKGSNYPAAVGAVGGIGLLYSRFKERAPEFWHKANMLARGAVAAGLPRQRNKVKVTYDMATSTYDQSSRIGRYERDRALGLDTTGANGMLDAPYVTPPFIKLTTSMFAKDVYGNLACAVEPGDRVTVDPTLSATYAGDYEVLDPKVIRVSSVRAQSSDGSISMVPVENGQEIDFTLGPYDESIFYDDSDDDQAGWPSVPGSDPGNNSNYTAIDLAAGGYFVFFTGQQPSGSQFQLPSTGFPSGNLLDWASAAGANIAYHSMRVIEKCIADANRNLTLVYTDDIGDFWNGDVGFAALTWLGANGTTIAAGLTWKEFTLLGGETIGFGMGVFADSAEITLPAGYSLAQAFAVAFVHDTPTTATNNPRIVGANVDSGGVVHCVYNDGAGNTWTGNAIVLVFAWKNNMGTVTTETVGTTKWMEITLSNGKKFGVGVALSVPDGGVLGLPAAAGAAESLQCIAGTSTFVVPGGAGHTQGVESCYVDADDVIHCTFGAPGNIVSGVADVFALYYENGVGTPVLVVVTPPSATIAAGATVGFGATVTGSPNPNVVWGVDGIMGGNLTVGTIDATGLYNAPNSPGTHTITATSVADPTASASATVTVFGSILTGNILTEDDGTVIYLDDGDTIDVD